MLRSYLAKQHRAVVLFFLCMAIAAVLCFFYGLPAEALLYGSVLCSCAGLLTCALGFRRYRTKHGRLLELSANIEEAAFRFPEAEDAVEADYQKLANALAADRTRVKGREEETRSDMLDYYTLWAHQIKTPIAAMQLLLEDETPDRSALKTELFRIEEYTEMVLSYQRLQSETTDYLFRTVQLDDCVRGCLRKYAGIFIRKKIRISFAETGETILTDDKWFSFVIGQILSNALKYTPAGGQITISGQNGTLQIRDNGIGIRAEDLPRIFDKGYTGSSGRTDRYSSGIGLYLCRRILTGLGCRMEIASEPGAGTTVTLFLANGPQVIE